jgi:hypothetical protein
MLKYFNMNYGQIYYNLIDRALNRTLADNVYIERHHIWPKCMGGPDEKGNIANLTAEEHFLAHQLLVKMFPDNDKLVYACTAMSMNSNGRINMKMYGWLKRKHSKVISEKMKGSTLNKGRKHSEEAKRKMSEAKKGKVSNRKGCQQSKDARLKMSESKKNMSDETKRKISEAGKGRIPWNKGKKLTSEQTI